MFAPPTRQLAVVRYAPGWGYAAREWAEALDRVRWQGSEDAGAICLKRSSDATSAVWRTAVQIGAKPVTVVVKVNQLSGWRQVVGSSIGWTKSHRQWRGAVRLVERHIAVARCCALLRGRNKHGFCEILILESIEGSTLLQCLSQPDLPTRKQHHLARAVGHYLAKLSRNHLVNRDGKPSNLIVQWTNNEPTLTIIDSVAISHVRSSTQDRALDRMMRDLLLEPMGCGCAPRRAMMLRTLNQCAARLGVQARSKWIRERWNQVGAMVAEHGDPTPRDNPLENESVV